MTRLRTILAFAALGLTLAGAAADVKRSEVVAELERIEDLRLLHRYRAKTALCRAYRVPTQKALAGR